MKESRKSAATPAGAQHDYGTRIRQATDMAETWWRSDGPFAPLHRYNALRVRLIRDRVARHFGRNPDKSLPLKDIRLLDINCGVGLLSESAVFMGAEVTGIDTSAAHIETARVHAAMTFVDIDYRVADLADLTDRGERFDVVANTMGISVGKDVEGAMALHSRLINPGGMIIVAARNGTWRSRLAARMGIRHVGSLLEAGAPITPDLVKPQNLVECLSRYGIEVVETVGITKKVSSSGFKFSTNQKLAYFAVGVRPVQPNLTIVR